MTLRTKKCQLRQKPAPGKVSLLPNKPNFVEKPAATFGVNVLKNVTHKKEKHAQPLHNPYHNKSDRNNRATPSDPTEAQTQKITPLHSLHSTPGFRTEGQARFLLNPLTHPSVMPLAISRINAHVTLSWCLQKKGSKHHASYFTIYRSFTSKGHAFPLVAVPAPLPKSPTFRSLRSIPLIKCGSSALERRKGRRTIRN